VANGERFEVVDGPRVPKRGWKWSRAARAKQSRRISEYWAAKRRAKQGAQIRAADKPVEEVDHPDHYNRHPSGVECIDIIEQYPFNIGTAMKHLWRAALKGEAITDLKKAAWYVNREIERVSK
jgi:hypothetical protein